MVGIIKETGQVHRNSGIFISKKMIAELGFILVIAVIALVAIEAFQSPTTSTGLQQKDAQQAEQATYTGSATSSLANGGQETNTEWNTINQEKSFNEYGINIKVSVGTKDYPIDVAVSDANTLWNQGKFLTVTTKFKIQSEDKIYQTGPIVIPQGGGAAGGWPTELAKRNPDPSSVLWQAELGTKNVK